MSTVKRGPTILQIIPRLDAGGAELSAIEITNAIVKAGGRAVVLTEGGRMADRIAANGGELVVFQAGTKNPARMLANAAAIVKMVRTEHVDLVHARSRAPAWSAIIGARRAGVPFVTTYHGAYNEKGPLKRTYNSVMARGDVVIANSGYTAGLIRSRYGTPANRIVVIHRGVDETAFDPNGVAPDRIEALRRAWGVDAGTRIVLLAARLTSWKGQPTVIDAAALLKDRGQLGNTVVILAGDAQGRTDYVAELEHRINAKGLYGIVRLVGHVADMPAAFGSAWVVLISSVEPEAFGRTSIEAQAMRCPVIATNIGAPPETVIDGQTGWLVPPSDGAALADRLAAALALTPEARATIGAAARTNAATRFTLGAMKSATLGVYNRLLKSGFTEPNLATLPANP